MKRFPLFLAAILAVSLSLPVWAQDAPVGWKTQIKTGGAKTFTPPDLRAGEIYNVTFYDASSTKGLSLEAYVREFAGTVGTKPGQLTQPLKIKVPNARVVSGTGFYVGPNETALGVMFFAMSPDEQLVHVSRTLFSSIDVLNRYQNTHRALNKAFATRARSGVSAAPIRESIPVGPTIPKPSGPLKAASLGGAKAFVKYYWTSYPTLKINIGHLLLFPDGTAFDAIPSKPPSRWSADEIRKSVPRFDVGTWKMAGNTLTLKFPQREREPQRTLTRQARGWNDPSEMEMNGDNYNIYFPVEAPPRTRLIGAWNNEELNTAGTIGGAAPLIAAGSSSDLNLRADGTFSGNSQSFFSATTSNMGDAFKPGEGNVTTISEGSRQSAGKWRLDGPLLTMEKDGKQVVHLAFLLPYWSKSAADTDLMLGDDRWKRPKK